MTPSIVLLLRLRIDPFDEWLASLSKTLADISTPLAFDTYLAYMFGGFIRRMGCKLRPYEKHHGETDRVINEAMRRLVTTFENDGDKEETLAEAVSRFKSIELVETRRSASPGIRNTSMTSGARPHPRSPARGARREPDRLRDFARQDLR